MAVTVARVHLAMAHAALPGLLPTPPEWKMAPPCAVILPKQSPPHKPAGRADAVDRWDACKNALLKSSSSKPGRADAAERWDARKIMAQANSAASSSSSSGSSHQRSSPDGKSSSSAGRAPSCDRWDSNKKSAKTSSSSSSSSILAPKRDGRKRLVSRGSSTSDERWDAHKKPRPPQLDDGESSSTGSNDMEVDDKPHPQLGFYAGPGFLAPPAPSMLPMPSFLVLPRCMVA